MRSISFFLLGHFLFPKQKSFFRKITLIAFTTVVISSFLSFLVLGSLNYFHTSLQKSFLAKKFHLSLPLSQNLIKNYAQITSDFSQKYPIKAFVPYSLFKGILYANGVKTPLSLQAIPIHFFDLMEISFLKGKFNEAIPSMVITNTLAQSLNCKIGDVVSFYTSFIQNSNTPTFGEIKLKITGILNSSAADLDSIAFAPFKILSSYSGNNNYLGILLQSENNTLNAKTYLKKKANTTAITDFLTDNENILYAFKWEKLLFSFVLGLIIIVSFVIIYMGFNVMLLHEKRSLFTLRILGISHNTLLGLFFMQSFSIGLLGSFLGLTLTILFFYNLLPFMALLYPSFFIIKDGFILTFNDITVILTLEFFAIFISLFLPALKLGELQIMEGLKND